MTLNAKHERQLRKQLKQNPDPILEELFEEIDSLRLATKALHYAHRWGFESPPLHVIEWHPGWVCTACGWFDSSGKPIDKSIKYCGHCAQTEFTEKPIRRIYKSEEGRWCSNDKYYYYEVLDSDGTIRVTAKVSFFIDAW